MAEQVQAVTSESSRQRAADVQRGTARAAVLGVSDGLVTNVSMILGISAAEASPGFVRLAGFASLAAGAFSMAVGEYVSMRAQVELLERLLLEETVKLQRNPEAVRAELEEFIAKAGVSRKTARAAVRQLCRDKRHVLGTYARSIASTPEYQDPSLLSQAWALPVAAHYQRHVDFQPNGSLCGPTSAANLAGYCTGHHRGKHQAPGWRHALAADGTLTVTTPTGLTAVTTPPPY